MVEFEEKANRTQCTVNRLNDGMYLPFMCGLFYLSCVIQSNARDRMINCIVIRCHAFNRN